jgi:hypothetical protein
MQNDYTKPGFKKLLQKLQEESWQLELIISGFAIFGLILAFEPLQIAAREAQNNSQIQLYIVLTVVVISCAILIFNLLLHVILRGLWIGALGLRYVSGEIDYEVLNYSKKFTNYLKKKVGSFDKYIGTLENYCSVIFAISFLLVFYVLAFTITVLVITLISIYIIGNEDLPFWLSKGVGVSLVVFIVIGMLLTFFDFITQGLLKKKQWVSKIYFPFYWTFSFLTLSFLYRPLVYNFLDNKFGKRISFILIPVYIVILLFTSLTYNSSNYFSATNSSNDIISNIRNYEDLIDENESYIDDVAIQSKVITDSYLKVFVIFSDNVEDRIFKFNPSLKPKEDNRGLSSDIHFGNNFIDTSKRDSLRREYLKAFNTIYSVKIDTIEYKSDFVISRWKKKDFGFETYLGIKNLTEGKHVVIVKRSHKKKDKTMSFNVAKIPFWYYKD